MRITIEVDDNKFNDIVEAVVNQELNKMGLLNYIKKTIQDYHRRFITNRKISSLDDRITKLNMRVNAIIMRNSAMPNLNCRRRIR